MVETTGKQLCQARLAKGLTIDEVAYATKLRPDKVLALEHDDYGRFPNNAYVKGFLQIYGRYLGVDVSGAVKELENPSPVSVSDYQYLNNVPVPETPRLTARKPAKKPSLAPLVVFLLLVVVAAGGGYLYVNAMRLVKADQPTQNANAASGQKVDGAGLSEPAKAPASDAARNTIAAQAPAPSPNSAAPGDKPGPNAPTASSIREATAPVKPPAIVSSDREFISQPTPPPVVTATVMVNEVVLEPVKKTWVIVRRDDPNSAPIFEDYLYTNAPPLKLRGARFFIEMRDEGAVMIRKNGAPIAYQGPGITIQ
jgi:cytoskeletal protein RodZ